MAAGCERPIKLSANESHLGPSPRALEAYRRSSTGNVPFALKSIGRVYAIRQDYDKAIQYQTEAYRIAMAQDARLEMAQSLLSLADTYAGKGDNKQAIAKFEEAKALAVELTALYEAFVQHRPSPDGDVFDLADVNHTESLRKVTPAAAWSDEGLELDALDWAREAIDRGAGELLVNSIDADGTKDGFDLELVALMREISSVPVIASGGAGAARDFAPAIHAGADAVLAASVFHSGELSIGDVKDALASGGIEVRR